MDNLYLFTFERTAEIYIAFCDVFCGCGVVTGGAVLPLLGPADVAAVTASSAVDSWPLDCRQLHCHGTVLALGVCVSRVTPF